MGLPAEPAGQPGTRFSLSPDGRRLAFVAPDPAGRVQLWVRPLSGDTAQPLAGTEGASAPFWSADSRYIAFTAGGKLRRIEAAGGAVSALCDSVAGLPGAWSADNVILFTPTLGTPLFRVNADGTDCRQATKGQDITRHAFPQFLADQRHFLYVSETANGSARHFEIASLDSSEVQVLSESGLSPTILNSGHVLYFNANSIWVQRIDARALTFQDPARLVVEGIDNDATGRLGAAFSASRDGVIVFQPSTVRPVTLTWFDRAGLRIRTFGPSDYTFRVPRLSPDGRWLAIDGRQLGSNRGGEWLFDLSSGAQRRFVSDPAAVTYATWSPDAKRIVFSSRRQGRMDLFENERDGDAGSERLLFADAYDKFPTSWSPDGHTLLYQAVSSQTGADIWQLPMSDPAPRRATPFVHTSASERSARFSPDGRWVAYSYEEPGRSEIRVASFPDARQVFSVSEHGGESPRWRKDGKELYFIAQDRTLHAVGLQVTGQTVTALSDAPLFGVPSRDSIASIYDVSPDGTQFIVPATDAPPARSLTLLMNFPFTASTQP
jgi:Tol biopolymer transport system component